MDQSGLPVNGHTPIAQLLPPWPAGQVSHYEEDGCRSDHRHPEPGLPGEIARQRPAAGQHPQFRNGRIQGHRQREHPQGVIAPRRQQPPVEQFVGGAGGAATGTIEARQDVKRTHRQVGLCRIEPPQQPQQQNRRANQASLQFVAGLPVAFSGRSASILACRECDSATMSPQPICRRRLQSAVSPRLSSTCPTIDRIGSISAISASERRLHRTVAQHHHRPNAERQPQQTARRDAGDHGDNRRRHGEGVAVEVFHLDGADEKHNVQHQADDRPGHDRRRRRSIIGTVVGLRCRAIEQP